MESMRKNLVWDLVDPPNGVRVVECKWVFKKKRLTLMERFTSIRRDWLQKVFVKLKELIRMKHFPQLQCKCLSGSC
jgi:hypothetical protein